MSATEDVMRFDVAAHEYTLNGTIIPSVTQLLEMAGLVESRFYTPAAARRGHDIHELTARYDLGAIDKPVIAAMTSDYKGYLLAHVKAMDVIRPTWEEVEVAHIHPRFKFGGRPDRVGKVYGALALVDIKSGVEEKHHAIQLAMQAILLGPRLPADAWMRYNLYVSQKGKFRFVRHDDRRDLDKALEIIQRFAG